MNDNRKTSAYWKNVLSVFDAPTSLVVDLKINQNKEDAARNIFNHTCSHDKLVELSKLTAKEGISLASVLQAGWSLLLGKYNATPSVLFGSAVWNSGEPCILPMRADIDGNQIVASFLSDFSVALKERDQHSDLGLAQIHQLSRLGGKIPLFESVIAICETNEQVESAALSDCALVLLFRPGNEISIQATYNANRFDETTIARMLGHYENILSQFCQKNAEPVRNLALMSGNELADVVTGFNQTKEEFPAAKCLHELFESNAANAPDGIAMVYNGVSKTYGELNQEANRVARYLRKLGVGPDALVGIFMERSLQMIASLIGILKAGGAYVPLDPAYPKPRLAFMIEDTNVALLLTQKSLSDGLPDTPAKVIEIDEEWRRIQQESSENLSAGATPAHLAYVIYTSGSTGSPKGAILNHQGRVNNFSDFNRRYQIGANDRLLGLASLSFDMSAYDVFGTLMAGGRNIVVEGNATLEPERWVRLMVENEITVWHSVPALLEMLVNYISERPELTPKSLRLVLLGGDWIPVNLPDRLKALIPGVHVVSMGGATECSMDSTIYDVVEPSSSWSSIPYGFPMANQLAYVLDQDLNPMPVGVPGELFLGGIGLGRGYHNRPELTAEKFIPNPFSGVSGDRIYRTGDLVRFMPNGNLELLGRIDFQVKIRGYRIELGEITSTLANHPAVKEAVVIAREDRPGDEPAKRNKRLVAYVAPNENAAEDSEISPSGLTEEHVNQWQMVYEETYGQTQVEEDDLTFNTIGWNSSYTGMEISSEEMAEWVKNSVDRIRQLQPKRALEIACGNGLLLFNIAPDCEKYMGVDFSSMALDQIKHEIERQGNKLSQVEVSQRLADNFTGIEADSFDTAIINSVVQLFPSVDYFVKVLAGMINSVKSGGYIYAGDIISYVHLKAFHTSIQLHQAPSSLSVEELRQRINKQLAQEEQLFIDPDLFRAAAEKFEKVVDVRLQMRRGQFLNEMTRFRYDVKLQIGGVKIANKFETVLDWQDDNCSLEALDKLLAENKLSTIKIVNIPNRRLAVEKKAMQLLNEMPAAETVGSLREVLNSNKFESAVNPEDIWQLEDKHPFEIELMFSSNGGVTSFDATFVAQNLEKKVDSDSEATFQTKPWGAYANNPLQGMLARKLIPELREYMRSKLPDYMVPTSFMLLDALPLSPNGKIDRRALPAPDHSRPELSHEYAPPSNELETVVADVWIEVFEVEQVGIHDNFLEMGGHSLIATQIMARLQDVFPIQLPLRLIFGAPTVVELSERIKETGDKVGVDCVEVAKTMIELGQMSDEEINALLSADED